ncbi:MAG: biotin/lipoate--protein ligase family protein [Paracoccaceae bacterium]
MSADGTTGAPSFPPLFRGRAVAAGQDPMAKAVAEAALGTDPGLIVYAETPDRLSAALVLAPEEPLCRAISVVFAVELGLGDALGALAPPEVAVHYDWPGGIRVNGAVCGGLAADAATRDPEAVPDWLVVGLEMPFAPDPDPGRDPARTALWAEGCAELTPAMLLESWSRHTLHWVNRWLEDGMAPVHEAWRGRAWALGEPLAGGGVFVGVDEWGGRLVKQADGTRLDPLTAILGRP